MPCSVPVCCSNAFRRCLIAIRHPPWNLRTRIYRVPSRDLLIGGGMCFVFLCPSNSSTGNARFVSHWTVDLLVGYWKKKHRILGVVFIFRHVEIKLCKAYYFSWLCVRKTSDACAVRVWEQCFAAQGCEGLCSRRASWLLCTVAVVTVSLLKRSDKFS